MRKPVLLVFGGLAALALCVAAMGQQQVVPVDGSGNTTPPQKVTVKAPSTAAAATDAPLVVVQSPVGTNPCANPSATLQAYQVTTTGTAAVQMIALSGTTKIYVCSLTVVDTGVASSTFSLETGTGTACATNTATLVPAFSAAAAAGTPVIFANPVTLTPAGYALCYLQTGVSPVVSLNLTYVQQ